MLVRIVSFVRHFQVFNGGGDDALFCKIVSLRKLSLHYMMPRNGHCTSRLLLVVVRYCDIVLNYPNAKSNIKIIKYEIIMLPVRIAR